MDEQQITDEERLVLATAADRLEQMEKDIRIILAKKGWRSPQTNRLACAVNLIGGRSGESSAIRRRDGLKVFAASANWQAALVSLRRQPREMEVRILPRQLAGPGFPAWGPPLPEHPGRP